MNLSCIKLVYEPVVSPHASSQSSVMSHWTNPSHGEIFAAHYTFLKVNNMKLYVNISSKNIANSKNEKKKLSKVN